MAPARLHRSIHLYTPHPCSSSFYHVCTFDFQLKTPTEAHIRDQARSAVNRLPHSYCAASHKIIASKHLPAFSEVLQPICVRQAVQFLSETGHNVYFDAFFAVAAASAPLLDSEDVDKISERNLLPSERKLPSV